MRGKLRTPAVFPVLTQHFRLRPAVLAVQATLAISVLAGVVAVAPSTVWAQAAESSRYYDIAPGSLTQVLNTFASQAGVELVTDASLLQGKQSAGLSGSYTASEGFAQVLRGQGLRAVRQANGSYGLQRAPEGGVATLEAVNVMADSLREGLTEGTGSFTVGSSNAATGMNLLLRETPQSISVMTRQRIDDQSLNSMADIMQQTVGVSTVQTGMANGAYIRGYQVSNFQIDGVSTTFQSFGTQSNMGFGSMDSAVYDSVTVVRGAAGLLTGAGDPSGIVSLVRKRPTREFQASLEGSLGRWDQYRAVADVGGPLNTTGTLRGRFVGAYSDGKSWVANYRGDRSVAYGIFEADLTEKTLLSLTLERSQESTKGASGNYTQALPLVYADGSLTPFDRHGNKLPAWASWDSTRNTVALSLEHALNDDWRVKLHYRHDDVKDWYKLLEAWGSFNQSNVFSGGFVNNRGDSNRTDSFAAVINGRYTFLGRQHDLVAGFNGAFTRYIQKHKGGGIGEWGFTGLSIVDGVGVYTEPDWNDASIAEVARTKTKQSGFYLGTRLHLTDRFSAIIGGRWSSWKYDDPDPGLSDHRKFSNVFVPYAGLVFDLTDHVSAYASYTEIFQPQSARDSSGSLLDPEQGKNYEIGFKGEWLDGRLNASIAAFETRKDNLAVYDYSRTGPTGDPVASAEDGTKGRGWEFEVSGELTPGWQLQGGYTYFTLRDAKGEYMNTDILPKHMFKLFTTYTPKRLPELTVGGGVIWQSKTYRINAQGALRDIYTQEAYAVANLMASYRFSHRLSLALNLNNVFDKQYRTRVHQHAYGAERNLSATLKYQF